MKSKHESFTWLRANGLNLGVLTGQDSRALLCADAAMQLYASCDYEAETHALIAFAAAVRAMQPSARYLAFHIIARSLDWHNRAEIWARCQLPELGAIPACKHGPRPAEACGT